MVPSVPANMRAAEPAADRGPAVRPLDEHRPVEHTPPRHFPALDGLRGLAVFGVFFFHYGGGRHSTNPLIEAFGYLCGLGWTGVKLFFLLSGFLITGLLWDSMGETHWFRNFYIRRALRILPLYYGTLLLLLLWPLFDHHYAFASIAKVVAVHALYLQNVPTFNALWKQQPNPFWMEHYWTLAVEEQFYLLWPLLLLLVKTLRQAAALCAAVVLGSFVFGTLNLVITRDYTVLEHSLPNHAADLAIGAAIAIAFRSRFWTATKRPLEVAGLVAGVSFLVGSALTTTHPILVHGLLDLIAAPIAFAGLLSSVLERGRLKRLLSARWLRWLGKISFGVYIFHWLPANGYNWLTQRISGQSFSNTFLVERMVLVAVLTLAISWLSFHFYETPFLRLKNRFAAHRPR